MIRTAIRTAIRLAAALAPAALLAAALAAPALAQSAPEEGPGRWTTPAAGADADRAARWGRTGGPVPATATDDMTMVGATQVMVDVVRQRLAQRIAAIPHTVAATRATLAANSPTGRADYFAWLVPWTLSFLVLGHAIVSILFGRLIVRPWFRRLLRPDPQGIGEKLPLLVLRAVIGLVTLGLTIVTGFTLGAAAFDAPENAQAQKTVVVVFGAFAAAFVLVVLWRLILAPALPAYRLARLDDHDARRLLWWLAIGSTVAVATHAFCTWMYELGLPDDVHAVITAGLTFLSVLVGLATIAFNRRAITGAILDGQPAAEATAPARIMAALWAPAAAVYALVAWADMTWRLLIGQPYGVPPVLSIYIILVSMIAVHGLVLFVIDRIVRRRRATGAAAAARATAAAAAAAGPRLQTFEDLAVRTSGILAMLAGAWALVKLWGVADMPILESRLDDIAGIAAVVLIGYVAYQAARIAIDQRLAAEGVAELAAEPGDEGGIRGATRLATLLPLVRTAILVVILTTAGAMVLLELGINLAPLFAGAGVVGIAIGFGAQYLIRDVFAGVFFLIDDAFRRGEYIAVGDVKGTVENISIRSFQLRHHLGPLQTIPFGEIKSLTNYSRDWVIMKLPLRVTYDTDVEKVRKLVKRLGEELLQDPAIGDQFLAPLKSQGVIEMQDSAMIIRVKFMCKPGDQWLIRQRVYQEIRALFLREGIKFAHREVTVRVAEAQGGPPLTEAQRHAAAAAALDPEAMEDWNAMPPAARAAGA